jgi:uncharacterized membrane protein
MAEPMSAVFVILAMAAVTYATRIGGVLLMRFVPMTPRVIGALRYLSNSVLVAIVVPAAIEGDNALRLAVVISALVMALTRQMTGAMLAGVVAAAIFRQLAIG